MSESHRSGDDSRFAVGDRVRVRTGVRDPDYPDMPMGGWTGAISRHLPERPFTYLVRWSAETLRSIHPIYSQRCKRDGVDLEEMWLDVDELEPDPGGPPAIEHPTSIVEPGPPDGL